MRALVVAVVSLSAFAARAARADGSPELVALAPAPDARACIAIGPSGEVFEPDGHGAWARKRAFEIAMPVVGALRSGAEVLAITRDGPPFRLAADGWTAIRIGTHGKPLTGSGTRPCAALGRAVYELGRAEPTKLPDAPAPVVALAASPKGVVIETERGLARLDGKTWKPIAGAPRHVARLLSDRFAITDRGVLDLRSNAVVAWPAGMRVAAATATDDAVLAVLEHGTALELATARAGKLAHEAIAATAPAVVVGVAGDPAGRVVVALRDGRLVVRDAGKWSEIRVHEDLPAPRPGPAPATSR